MSQRLTPFGKPRRFPTAEIRWRTAFIKFNEIEPRRTLLVQVSKARSLKQDGEALTGDVAPPGLLHKAIEDLDLSFAWPAAIGITPFENLLVRPAGEHPLAQLSVLDVEEREAMAVEFAAQIVVIGLGKVAACIQADLIEHARKIDQAADNIVRTAR